MTRPPATVPEASPTASAPLGAAADLLRGSERVWLGTHVDPDGDAIGSLLGLTHALRDLGKTVAAACADPPPRETMFLPGTELLVSRPPEPGEVAVALDAAEPDRLGALYVPEVWGSLATIVVDHHASNPGFGDVDVIEPTAASTAEIVLRLADALGEVPSADAATCLLTGIVTDTLGFRTPNTTDGTLAAATRLMQLGAPLAEITYQVFYRRPLAELQLAGRALERAQWVGPFLIATLPISEMQSLGVGAEAARGLTSVLATADEPLAVALLRERDDGSIDVSMRAKPQVDLLPAALALGGGGHPQASGARLDGPMDRAVATVAAALRDRVRRPPAGP